MRKILMLLLFCQAVFSKEVEMLETTDSLQKPKYQEFIYLNDHTNISSSKPVAIIRSRGSLKNPARIFEVIKSHAQSKGANSFRFIDFKKIGEEGEMILQTFFTTDSILGINFENIPKNKVFVFGSQNLLEKNSQSYKINETKYKISSGQYAVFEVKIGGEIRVSKGGFTGEAKYIKGEEGKSSKFYSFSGIGIIGGGTEMSRSGAGVGVSVTTGQINNVEPNLALLLLRIYTEKP